ncbi:MAG: hypothetical protein OHK0036_04710 [Bacteroidia bacterium]
MNPKITEWFDQYLSGQMSEKEQTEFINTLNENSELKKHFEEYQLLINSFKSYHQKNEIENKFNQWYADEMQYSSKNVKKIWWSVSYIAASVALLVTLTGIWLYESLNKQTKKQSTEISYLKKELKQIQNQQNTLVRNIKKIQEKTYAPANSQSTGFVFAPHYILTTFHSIQNADSIFVENDFQVRTQAQLIYTNKDLDVAVLYAPQMNAKPNFYFSNAIHHLGNRVFTLGYPTNQLVYNEGYISAMNGYNNDSAYYQITMSLNPGNSGGPLFSNTGELIGMIVSKNINMEGVAFALKSSMIYTLKDSLPADSIKHVWMKAFRKKSSQNASIQNIKPFVLNIYVYQKSI